MQILPAFVDAKGGLSVDSIDRLTFFLFFAGIIILWRCIRNVRKNDMRSAYSWILLAVSIIIGFAIAFPFSFKADVVKSNHDDCTISLSPKKTQLIQPGVIPIAKLSTYSTGYSYINGETSYPTDALKLQIWSFLPLGLHSQYLVSTGNGNGPGLVQWWTNSAGDLCLRGWSDNSKTTDAPDYDWEINYGFVLPWWGFLYWFSVGWIGWLFIQREITYVKRQKALYKNKKTNEQPVDDR